MPDVIVVGGGIIGLTAAARLRDQGATVTIWSAHDPLDTTSAVAAAVWYPTRTDYDPRVLTWAAATYTEFRHQAAQHIPGVLLRPTRNILTPAAAPEPSAVAASAPAGAASERGRAAVAGAVSEPWWASAAGEVTYAGKEIHFEAPLVEMDTYLPWLRTHLESSGVRLHKRRISDLSEALAQASVVVNATGLAAGRLCQDPNVFPVRGQILIVANPGLTTSIRTETDPPTYIHPRTSDVVLGGTYQEGNATLTPDRATRAAILQRCVALVPELAEATILTEKVGLRPARHGGPRVEAEPRDDGTIIHAYGHGGAGMTLSWGCADEITHLARQAA
ncbi:FAD-dependent oxidoreductase [Winogradskya humida]|uniref:D-amino-acid oxidase n=1 Tax=Winogradskya humida TaxID=113566 RepID=A0ABQ3ZI39_9ACTN|nr:FAD-dependent oxidoreductase [Actinoplanes humidus]GIE18250.1 amino acid oxidase [Actinoplanes humidus]